MTGGPAALLAACLAFAGAAGAQESADPLVRSRELRELGSWGEAWAVLETADPLATARGRTELAAAAGDLAATLRHAEEGLVLEPDALDLRWHALSVLTRLGAAEPAQRHVRALAASLARAELAPEDRASWEEAAESFERRAEALAAESAAREAALARARWGSLLVLALLVATLVALLRPARPADGEKARGPARVPRRAPG